MILQKLIAVVFLLFVICFIAIVIEELFLGGKRRRKLERQRRMEAGTVKSGSGQEKGGS
jgi:NADH:ubiquinone oxidoreductase subunit 3 (subunit A)